jgi:uncharacterized protein
MITRRHLLQGIGLSGAALVGASSYAFAYEPLSYRITSYAVTPPGWPANFPLRLAVIADPHFCEPWTGLARLQRIVADTNALQPDAVLLLGDYEPGTGIQRWSTPLPSEVWAHELARLTAPFGVHAIMGNHDWWEDAVAQRAGQGPTAAHRALAAAGIRVHENLALRFEKRVGHNVRAFWLAGIGDQWAFHTRRQFKADSGTGRRYRGVDDLDGTLGQVTDDAPVVLMIHEPDLFPRIPKRVSLTLAGHTHGGQVRLLGYAPVVPSRFRNRYVYGHIVEEERHLIVSAGLGVSGLPVRFGAQPEIVVVDLGDPTPVT